MSATGGLKSAAAGRAMSRPQWLRANVATMLALLMRAPRTRAVFAWRTPPLRLAVGAIVAAVAILVLMVAVDAWAIVQARKLPHWLAQLFNWLTDLGKSGWFLMPLGVLLAAIAVLASPALPRVTRLVLTAISVRLAFLFLAIGAPSLFSSIVKNMIGRARPFVGGVDPFLFRPFNWTPAYASLPSGHATTAFAAAIALGALWPKGRPLFWAYALVIALSRVVITAHHPSDVLAGAIVGILGALIVRDAFALRRLGFVPDREGGAFTLPGPSFARIKRVARRLVGQ